MTNNFPMGNCAEHVAKQHGITRADQDAHALESYARAAAAWSAGKFDAEIAEVTIKHPKGDIVVREDEEFKKVLPAKVPSLKPVFIKAEQGGTVTPANASGIQDGASAVVLMTGEAVAANGVQPLAKILGWADAAIDPIDFPIAPTVAIPLALKNAGITADQVDLYELNEAFSGASRGPFFPLAAPPGLLSADFLPPLAHSQSSSRPPRRSATSTRQRSTSTAVRSRSATRSARPARASSSRSSTRSSRARSALRPSATAAGPRRRSSSSASEARGRLLAAAAQAAAASGSARERTARRACDPCPSCHFVSCARRSSCGLRA